MDSLDSIIIICSNLTLIEILKNLVNISQFIVYSLIDKKRI